LACSCEMDGLVRLCTVFRGKLGCAWSGTMKINFQGQMVDADEIGFKSLEESWNDYFLEDGSRVKVKLVTTAIYKIKGAFDQEGNPLYAVKSANIMAVTAPENLRKK
jgi:hypothetical protein